MIIFFILLAWLLMDALVIFGFGFTNTNRKLFMKLAFIKLFALMALRAESVGADLPVYIENFRKVAVDRSPTYYRDFRFGAGYTIFVKMLTNISVQDRFFIACTSAIIMGSVTIFILRYSKNVFLSVYLFITLLYYYQSMNAIRQYLAMSILLLSIGLLKKHKLLFCCAVGLASLFHTSALIFLLAVPLSALKVSRSGVLLVSGAGLLSYLFLDDLFEWICEQYPYYRNYLKSIYFVANKRGAFLELAIAGSILIFATLYQFREKIPKKYMPDFMYYCSVVCFFISLWGTKATLFFRACDYFSIFNIIVIPNALSAVKSRRLRFVYTYLIILICAMYNFMIFQHRSCWHKVVPYLFFWQ